MATFRDRRGLLFAISGPPGSGTARIAKGLSAAEPELETSISVTTRPRAPTEEEGVDYYFVETVDFNLMIKRNELAEHAKIYGHYYGTPGDFLMNTLAQGCDVLLEIDWQGAQQLAQRSREDLVTVLILPTSLEDARARLTREKKFSKKVIEQRMALAPDAISHWPEYDYVLANDSDETVIEQLSSILLSERTKRERQPSLIEVARLLSDGAPIDDQFGEITQPAGGFASSASRPRSVENIELSTDALCAALVDRSHNSQQKLLDELSSVSRQTRYLITGLRDERPNLPESQDQLDRTLFVLEQLQNITSAFEERIRGETTLAGAERADSTQFIMRSLDILKLWASAVDESLVLRTTTVGAILTLLAVVGAPAAAISLVALGAVGGPKAREAWETFKSMVKKIE